MERPFSQLACIGQFGRLNILAISCALENSFTDRDGPFNQQVFIENVCFFAFEGKPESDSIKIESSIDGPDNRDAFVKIMALGMPVALDYSIDHARRKRIKQFEHFIIHGTWNGIDLISYAPQTVFCAFRALISHMRDNDNSMCALIL